MNPSKEREEFEVDEVGLASEETRGTIVGPMPEQDTGLPRRPL